MTKNKNQVDKNTDPKKDTSKTQPKINISLIVGIIGALSWLPFFFEKCAHNELEGKLLSIYQATGTFDDKNSSMLIFKIGVLSRNQNFNLKDIDLKIKFINSGWKSATAQNSRFTLFTFDGIKRRLTIKNEEFINNLVLLPKDQAIVGYIFTTIPELIDEEITDIEIIFQSFDKKNKKITIKSPSIKEHKLSFDDSIWEPVDSIPTYVKAVLKSPIIK